MGGRAGNGAKLAGAQIADQLRQRLGSQQMTTLAMPADSGRMDDGQVAITIAINSPGGDVFDGFAIHNALLRLGARCTVRIDGLAASAASVIACGGHRVVMAANAMLMIHNPWTFTYGSAHDLRKTADMMDKARDGILAAYRRKAPAIEDATLIQMLDEETWLSADEALALGLVDVIGESVALQACRGTTNVLARFKHPPEALLAASAELIPEEPAQAPEPQPDPTRLSRNAARFSQACLACGLAEFTEELLMNTPLSDDGAVSAQIERLQAIRTLCASARLPELAADYARAFGDESTHMPDVLGIIVSADADNTHGNGLAYVGDIHLNQGKP